MTSWWADWPASILFDGGVIGSHSNATHLS